MCTVLLPPGVNTLAVNKYIISYHMYHISYHVSYIWYITHHIIYHIMYHIWYISYVISYISYPIIYHIISYIISCIIYHVCLIYDIYIIYLVYLIYLIYDIYLIYLVYLVYLIYQISDTSVPSACLHEVSRDNFYAFVTKADVLSLLRVPLLLRWVYPFIILSVAACQSCRWCHFPSRQSAHPACRDRQLENYDVWMNDKCVRTEGQSLSTFIFILCKKRISTFSSCSFVIWRTKRMKQFLIHKQPFNHLNALASVTNVLPLDDPTRFVLLVVGASRVLLPSDGSLCTRTCPVGQFLIHELR